MSAEAAGLRDVWLSMSPRLCCCNRPRRHRPCYDACWLFLPFFPGSQGPVVYNSIVEAKGIRFNPRGNGLKINFGKLRRHGSIEHRAWNVELRMRDLVDDGGFEPPTPALRTRCSPN